MESSLASLRHALATVAYRATRALEDAPPSFACFEGGGRQPVRILAHMGDLYDWALSMAEGSPRWNVSGPLDWPEEQQRFFASLGAFDAFLASGAALPVPVERLFQGPVADSLTHVGQLAMLRRMAGYPIRGENYFAAEMTTGNTGPDQPPPVQKF